MPEPIMKPIRVEGRRKQRRKAMKETNEQLRHRTTHGESREFNIVSMFSGCGGMDLGFMGGFEIFGRRYERLPFGVVWANEHNPKACATYRQNISEDILCGDVWDALDSLPEKADVLIGGFPCQDISVNGKRAGANGKRSGLYK